MFVEFIYDSVNITSDTCYVTWFKSQVPKMIFTIVLCTTRGTSSTSVGFYLSTFLVILVGYSSRVIYRRPIPNHVCCTVPAVVPQPSPHSWEGHSITNIDCCWCLVAVTAQEVVPRSRVHDILWACFYFSMMWFHHSLQMLADQIMLRTLRALSKTPWRAGWDQLPLAGTIREISGQLWIGVQYQGWNLVLFFWHLVRHCCLRLFLNCGNHEPPKPIILYHTCLMRPSKKSKFQSDTLTWLMGTQNSPWRSGRFCTRTAWFISLSRRVAFGSLQETSQLTGSITTKLVKHGRRIHKPMICFHWGCLVTRPASTLSLAALWTLWGYLWTSFCSGQRVSECRDFYCSPLETLSCGATRRSTQCWGGWFGVSTSCMLGFIPVRIGRVENCDLAWRN